MVSVKMETQKKIPMLIELLMLYFFTICSARSFFLQPANSTYKPVVIIHGLFDDVKSMYGMKKFIQEAHPGTNVTVIDLYTNEDSLKPLWPQVHDFGEAVKKIAQEAENGIHLLCYSQGGAVCRGVLSTLPDHNVQSFIALSSPLMGQYGETDEFKFLPPSVRKDVYLFCYYYGQALFSVCQYWNDPIHQDLYKDKDIFLAVLNNETIHKNNNSTEWKKNFLNIKNMVLIGGPDDGVITPWQSSHFGFYDSNLNVVEMKNQTVYQKDYFGLQTLDRRGAITTYQVSGVEHTHWHVNKTVFDNCIKKWLD